MLKKLRIYKTRLKKVTFHGPLPPSLVYTETEQILGMVEPNIELFYLLKPYVRTHESQTNKVSKGTVQVLWGKYADDGPIKATRTVITVVREWEDSPPEAQLEGPYDIR